MTTPSPIMSQNHSSIRSSQTKSDDPYNLSLKHDDGDSDNENDSQITNAGVVCCNTKLVQALKDLPLAETLTLLADPTVLNSLRALKKPVWIHRRPIRCTCPNKLSYFSTPFTRIFRT